MHFDAIKQRDPDDFLALARGAPRVRGDRAPGMVDLTALVLALGTESPRAIWVASPLRVTIGGVCPLQCPGCRASTARGTLPVDAARRGFVAIRPFGSAVLLAGGDPLTNRDLRETIEAARHAGLAVELLTPGVFVSPRRARELVALGISGLRVALDSRRYDLSDSLRGAAAAAWAGLAVDLQLNVGSEGVAGLRDRVRCLVELDVRRVIVSSRGCRVPGVSMAPWLAAQVVRAMLVDAAGRGGAAASVCLDGAEFDEGVLLEALGAVGGPAAVSRLASRLAMGSEHGRW